MAGADLKFGAELPSVRTLQQRESCDIFVELGRFLLWNTSAYFRRFPRVLRQHPQFKPAELLTKSPLEADFQVGSASVGDVGDTTGEQASAEAVRPRVSVHCKERRSKFGGAGGPRVSSAGIRGTGNGRFSPDVGGWRPALPPTWPRGCSNASATRRHRVRALRHGPFHLSRTELRTRAIRAPRSGSPSPTGGR